MSARSEGSAELTVAALERELERRPRAAYLVLGEEPYLRRRAVESIVGAVVGTAAGSEMSVERLDGSSTTAAEVLDAARSLSLFAAAGDDGPSRVVVVRGFDAGCLDGAEELRAYLEDPTPATCLVFEADKIDKRYAAGKVVEGGTTTVDCDPPTNVGHVKRWIHDQVGQRGCEIEPDAVDYLVEMVSREAGGRTPRFRLQPLIGELEKATLYAGPGGTIGSGDVERLLGHSREHSVFELTDCLVGGDGDAAVAILNELIDEGQAPPAILGMIAWIARQLLTARDLAAKDVPRREAQRQLGGLWSKRGAILERGARSSGARLRDALVACSEADLKVKVLGGGGAVRGILEELCRRLAEA